MNDKNGRKLAIGQQVRSPSDGAVGRVIAIGRKYVTVKYGPAWIDELKERPIAVEIVEDKRPA